MRLLPSGAASRAQQSAVICREGCRAVKVGCGAQGVWVAAACGVATGSKDVVVDCLLLPLRAFRAARSVLLSSRLVLEPIDHG